MGRRHPTPFLACLVLVSAVFLTVAGPVSAASSATAPCWKQVVLDWAADGKVDATYPLPCYQQAIANLRPDLALYSSAGDDIRRALQRAIKVKGDPAANTTGGDPSPAATEASAAAASDGGGVPLPLLVLGGVAILLVTAGLAGLVWKRSHGDRPGTS
jgi:hypothetical protein